MKSYKSLLTGLALIAGFIFIVTASNSFATSFMVWAKTSDSEYESTGNIHDFTGLPLTADGWTDFQAMLQDSGYADARVVFVSRSQGNDNIGADGHYTVDDLSFDGHGIFQPNGTINAYKTIAAGYGQLRTGYPDILLLKRGDVWEEALKPATTGWRKSGRSQTERMIVSSYGNAALDRPVLQPETQVLNMSGGQSATPRSFLIFSGFLAYAPFKDPFSPDYGPGPSNGISGLDGGQDILFEDIHLLYMGMGIQSFYNTYSRLAIRRCVIDRTWPTSGGHSQGLYAEGVEGFLLEENVFHRNGWNPDVGQEGTIYNHNAYIQYGNSGVIFRRNISARASSHGVHLRPGGVMENNLFLQNALVQFGYGQDSAGDYPIASGSILHNVVLDSRNVANVNPRGFGLLVTAAKGVDVFNNIIAQQRSGSANIYGIALGAGWDHVASRRLVEDVVLQDNIVYKWQHPQLNGNGLSFIINKATDYSIANITVEGNSFQQTTDKLMHLNGSGVAAATTFSGNKYYSGHSGPFSPGTNYAGWLSATGETGSEFASVSYPDPDRDIRSYIKSLGNNYTDYQVSLEAFLGEAVQQRRGYWREEYTACAVNNYIRAGFNKDEIVCFYQ